MSGTGDLDTLKKGRANSHWINEHMNELQEKHPGEFIAVDDQKIIAHGEEQDEVIEKANKRTEHPRSMIITFVYSDSRYHLRR